MPFSDKPYTLDSVVRMILSAGFAVCFIWLMGYLSGALIPFVTALLIAYLLNPITTWIEEKVGNRSVAVLLTIVLLVGGVGGIATLVIPMMLGELTNMGRVLGDLATNKASAERAREFLPPELWAWVRDFIRSEEVRAMFTVDGIMSTAQSLFDKLMPGIRGIMKTAGSFLAGIIGLTIIHLYLIFLLADFGRIKENWQNYLPSKYRQSIVDFLLEFEQTMSTYFRGQIIIALLVGVLLSIGFVIIGLPMALVLGMFTGILNIAPYLGTLGLILALPLSVLGALETGQSPMVAMGLVLVVFAVVQAIQEVVLIPKIQGKSLGLSPWLILLALSIWGQLLGFLGLLIALPMTCLFLSYYRRMLAKKEAV